MKHGSEGTHSACQEMTEKLGAKVGCCECNGHKCKPTNTNEISNKLVDWEKRFRKEFRVRMIESKRIDDYLRLSDDIEQFIQKELDTALHEQKEGIRNEIKELLIKVPPTRSHNTTEDSMFNLGVLKS